MHRHLFWIVIGIVGIGTGFGQNCTLTTTVRFVDDQAQPISNITVDQLKAEIESSPAKVVAVSPAPKPKIVLLIDASSSMKGTWGEAIAAAKQFATTANNDIAVVVFRDRIVGGSNNHNDTEKLLNELSGLQLSQGGTALYDTLVEVANGVKDPDIALVMIGDGEDNMSHHSSDQVVSMFLRSSWPPVFGLILDYDHQQTRREYFRKIAFATGGLTVVPSSASKVAEAQASLLSGLLAPFRITLEASRPISKPVKLKLDLVGPRHGIHIIHPAQVTACDSFVPPSEKAQ